MQHSIQNVGIVSNVSLFQLRNNVRTFLGLFSRTMEVLHFYKLNDTQETDLKVFVQQENMMFPSTREPM